MKLLIPPPVQMVVTLLAMWGVDYLLADLRITFPWQMGISGAIIAAGLLIDVIALIAFARAKTSVNPVDPGKASKLVVKDGLYRFSRNPMYLGMAVLLAGWALWLGNPVNVLLWLGFIYAITVLQIKPEEEILTEKFGTQYADYCARVRRWI